MKSREIKHWLRGAAVDDAESPYNSDDEMAPRRPRTESAESEVDWDTLFERILGVLRSSRTASRENLLVHGVPAVAEDENVESEQRADLALAIYATSDLHARHASRSKSFKAVDALIAADMHGVVLTRLYDAVKQASSGLIGSK